MVERTECFEIKEHAMAKWIEWVEPMGKEVVEPVYLRTRDTTAIKVQRVIANKKGYTYESDQRALEDFITVNWAKEIELEQEQ